MILDPAVPSLRLGTPLEDHLTDYGLLVKREDLACPPPGPPFSKTRGVLAHMSKRYDEGTRIFGALDTSHSQAGHAVAWGAKILGAKCVNYFPVYRADQREPGGEGIPRKWLISTTWDLPVARDKWLKLRDPQLRSNELQAELVGLPAGRSAVLYHAAKKDCLTRGGYMMPNALRLPETIEETAAEVVRTFDCATAWEYDFMSSRPWLISISSATIAAGVIRGMGTVLGFPPEVILHMGYSRSHDNVLKYVHEKAGEAAMRTSLRLVDEDYAYKDVVRKDMELPFPANPHYDRKAVSWWMREGKTNNNQAFLWLIG